jgi:predicted transcriptional regulator
MTTYDELSDGLDRLEGIIEAMEDYALTTKSANNELAKVVGEYQKVVEHLEGVIEPLTESIRVLEAENEMLVGKLVNRDSIKYNTRGDWSV